MSTISNGLKELKIALKMVSIEEDRMNSASSIENRRQYASEFAIGFLNKKKKILFIDECGFNLHLRRSQARAKVGERVYVVVPTVR